MSASDEEQSGTIDTEESIDESHGDTEGASLSDQESEGKQAQQPQPGPQIEKTDQSTQRPTGVEDRVVQSQEKSIRPSGTKAREKPKSEDISRKLYDQFTKHFQVSKLANNRIGDTLSQVQKQLSQIDKTTTVGNKQQIAIKQLVGQVRAIQKQLDKISSSINRLKTIPRDDKDKSKRNSKNKTK